MTQNPGSLEISRRRSADDTAQMGPQNIMYDRRVCRGSTYARRVAPQSPTNAPPVKKARARPRNEASRRQGPGETDPNAERTKTPDPVAGRSHSEIQTEAYLEVLTDKPEEVDAHAQTDSYMDRPDSPRFVPKPSGESKSTQIEEGDLFDFDLEVRPIVEVLVGKTLDQSIMEVLENHELEQLRIHQEQFEQLRNVELAETQRLEARETRLFEEKQRRKKQEHERIEKEEELAKKIASRTVAKQYLLGLQSKVFQNLTTCGHFTDPLVREIEETFMPWLVDSVVETVDQMRVARSVTDGIVADAIQQGLQDASKCLEATDTMLKKRAAEEEKRRQEAAAEEERKRLEAEQANEENADGEE